jgi:hypothetical protein
MTLTKGPLTWRKVQFQAYKFHSASVGTVNLAKVNDEKFRNISYLPVPHSVSDEHHEEI